MGCTVSIQPSNSLPQPPSPKNPSLKSSGPFTIAAQSLEPTPPHANSESLSGLSPKRKTLTLPSPQQKSVNFSTHGSEILQSTGYQDTLIGQEEDGASTRNASPRSSFLNRRAQKPSLEGSPTRLARPSNFYREKLVSSGDLETIPNQTDPNTLPDPESSITVKSVLFEQDISKTAAAKPIERTRALLKSFEVSTEDTGSPKNNNQISSPKFYSKESHKAHRTLKKADPSKTAGALKSVVKEESESEEVENLIGLKKETSLHGKINEVLSPKDKLKIHIEQKFTVNLVEKVLSSRRVTERKMETPDVPASQSHRIKSSVSIETRTEDDNTGLSKLESANQTSEMISARPTPRSSPPKTSFKRNLQLSLTIDGDAEDQSEKGTEGDGTKGTNVRHTPLKKSLFSSVFDTAEMGPTPTGTNKFSYLGVSGKNLTLAVEKKPTSPSILLSERKYKHSETSLSSVRETKILDKTVDEDGQKKINQYILAKELGRGSFGKVKLGVDSNSGIKYAIKIVNRGKLNKRLLSRDKTMFLQIQTELAVMKKMSHSNIVQLFEVIDDSNSEKLYLVMEFVHRGAVMSTHYWNTERAVPQFGFVRAATEKPTNWKGMIKGASRRFSEVKSDDEDGGGDKNNEEVEKKPLEEMRAKSYFRDLILGLDYMHNYANVIHRDIKPENLLIDEYDTLKISDFNVSCMLEDDSASNGGMMKNGAGTKTYLAPEAWLNKKHRGEPLDIWAAGATLYYFLYSNPPFKSGRLQELKEMILNKEPEFPEEIQVSDGAINLIKACLKKDPNERITLEQIMKDPWLTDDGDDALVNNGAEKVVVTPEDISKAFTSKLKATITIALGLKRRLTLAKSSLLKKSTLDVSQISSLDCVE